MGNRGRRRVIDVEDVVAWTYGMKSLPRRAGAPDPDALAIEAAIATLGDSMAGLAAPAELAFGLHFPADLNGAFAIALSEVANIVRVHGGLRKRPGAGLASPRTIKERAEYFVWRLGLEYLAAALSGQLAGFAVLAPSAPALPWVGETDSGKPPALMGPRAPEVFGRLDILALETTRRNRERRRIVSPDRDPRRPSWTQRSAKLDGAY